MELVALPDDALAQVLRRLPPRGLAAARCVCKAWRGVVDTRGLLLPHLLPHSVRGIFANYIKHNRPHLFARPASTSTIPRIDGMLGFMPNDHTTDRWFVLDHCNGLLLCQIEWGRRICVCNPATRRWVLLPEKSARDFVGAYLVFDPAVSPHHEVFLIPPGRDQLVKQQRALLRQQEMDAPFVPLAEDTEEFQQPVNLPQPPPAAGDLWRLIEWPLSPWILNVFSSRTGRWEERAFVREGKPAGTVADMLRGKSEPMFLGPPRQHYAVYWHGALYVDSSGAFVTRFSLSNGTYQVIKTPANIEKNKSGKPYLGRSEKGVYFGTIHECQLQVWILNESCGLMEWVLKHEDDLSRIPQQVKSLNKYGPWIIEEDNIDVHQNMGTPSEENFEWDSDNDDFLATEGGGEDSDNDDFLAPEGGGEDSDNDVAPEGGGEGYESGYLEILGFHPYKEVVFLTELFGTVAYHLSSSKIQNLGNLRPKCYYCDFSNGVYESFVYTPCMIGELHGDEFRTNSED